MVMVVMAHVEVVVQPLVVAMLALFAHLSVLPTWVQVGESSHLLAEALVRISGGLLYLAWVVLYRPLDGMALLLGTKTGPEGLLVGLVRWNVDVLDLIINIRRCGRLFRLLLCLALCRFGHNRSLLLVLG